jgi:hypothetical protein
MEERTMIDIVWILFGLVMLYKMDTMVLYSTSPAGVDPQLVVFESAAAVGEQCQVWLTDCDR